MAVEVGRSGGIWDIFWSKAAKISDGLDVESKEKRG